MMKYKNRKSLDLGNQGGSMVWKCQTPLSLTSDTVLSHRIYPRRRSGSARFSLWSGRSDCWRLDTRIWCLKKEVDCSNDLGICICAELGGKFGGSE